MLLCIVHDKMFKEENFHGFLLTIIVYFENLLPYKIYWTSPCFGCIYICYVKYGIIDILCTASIFSLIGSLFSSLQGFSYVSCSQPLYNYSPSMEGPDGLCSYLCWHNGIGKTKLPDHMTQLKWDRKQHAGTTVSVSMYCQLIKQVSISHRLSF